MNTRPSASPGQQAEGQRGSSPSEPPISSTSVERLARLLYCCLLYLLAPLAWLMLARRGRRAGGRWEVLGAGRFGYYGRQQAPARTGAQWVHAVSVGETRAAQPLVQQILAAGHPVLLTHMTATGRAEGERLFAAAIASGQLQQAWIPYDFPGATRRFLAYHQPAQGILIEREIWPNLLAAARQRGLPVALASARFSGKSLRQARRFAWLIRPALRGLAPVLAQTQADAGRLTLAGARNVQVVGNLKFDQQVPARQLQAGRGWRIRLGRPVILIASTREGEDVQIAQAIAALLRAHLAAADCLFVLVPRHPQRFDSAAAVLAERELPARRRSESEEVPLPGLETAVLLGDSMGELAFFYAAADVAIVAGSFEPMGGHNLIEACLAGAPVIVGPHTFNFKDAVEDALARGACLRAGDADAAVKLAWDLVCNDARRTAMAARARQWADSHTGATARMMTALGLDAAPAA
ncbi:3-deoxy-D-manno-octulosonic-acid transferase [Kerstersia gyiorum]|uniref:3-deoxy-D-manno-octulosonic acid transferase n=1 Tax=Kerstersia gyiorum TaxID=206506 RepID=A0A4Q7MWB8_9BURK|nr:3-deoxy-D-manno-octulosonic acid transferase [Kerstersia gyiorum]RZS73328.1 3-deoxy-D-manno-octulosonic-acid transferase [Kerstersia gyiorum]